MTKESLKDETRAAYRDVIRRAFLKHRLNYIIVHLFIFSGMGVVFKEKFYYCSFLFIVFVLFLFCFISMLSLELCRCSPDIFPVSSRPRTRLSATTYTTGYG